MRPGPFRRLLLRLLPCALLATLASSASGQLVRGVVSDRATYAPIDLGTVVVVTESADTVARTVTNEQGYFTVRVPETGAYYLFASALGYRSVRSDLVELAEDEVKIVEMTLSPQPIEVGGLRVEAAGVVPEIPGLVGTGFYERLAEGKGEYILPGEIASSPARYTQQLFWGKRLIRVRQRSHERPGPWNDLLLIPNRDSAGYCAPAIYIDGVHIPELLPGESITDAAPKEELEAVEIYQWPFGVPWQYSGRETCGVILFWTKAR